MSQLVNYVVCLCTTLKEFLALHDLTQAAAARAIGVNHYTFNAWAETNRVPLTSYKALAQRFDPQAQSLFADITRHTIKRAGGAKKDSATATTRQLAAQWDASHPGLTIQTASGDRLRVHTMEAPAEAVAPAQPASTDANDARAALRATREAAEARARKGALPPESEVLLALVVRVAQERDDAAAAARAAAQRAEELELQVAISEEEATKARADRDEWAKIAEELAADGSSAPARGREAAVDNLRTTVQERAPQLLATLESVLGNLSGSCA